MKLEKLKEILQIQDPFIFEGECIDCGIPVMVTTTQDDTDISIKGGAVFQPPVGWNCPQEYMHKCDNCFNKSPVFNPKTEIYSRCVGYLRPVNNYNPGKKAEWKSRKTFEIESMNVYP